MTFGGVVDGDTVAAGDAMTTELGLDGFALADEDELQRRLVFQRGESRGHGDRNTVITPHRVEGNRDHVLKSLSG